VAKDLYSLRQAAEMIGVSQATIRRAYRRSQVIGLETSSAILLNKKQVDELSKHCYARPRNADESRSTGD